MIFSKLNLKNHLVFTFLYSVLTIACFIGWTLPASAALAPVESRHNSNSKSSHVPGSGSGAGSRASGSGQVHGQAVPLISDSESVIETPIFVGTDQTTQNTSSRQNTNSSSKTKGGGYQSISNANARSSSSPRSSSNTENSNSSASYAMNSQDRAAHLTLSQIENLQRELSELRGLVETQDHMIKQLKKSQQDLYLDLERRLNQVTEQRAALKTNGVKTSLPNVSSNPSIKDQPGSKSAKDNSTKDNSKSTVSLNKNGAGMTKAVTTGVAAANTTATATVKATAAAMSSSAGNNNVDNMAEIEADEGNPVNEAALGVEASSSKPHSTALLGEKESYQNAYSLLRSKKYDEAIESFKDYLTRFKKGDQAPQAHYWLGEVYMVQWQQNKKNGALLEKAMTEFTNITREYPNHSKTADALLKLGLIEIDKGNPEKALSYLSEVKARYPGTAAARVAENRLQQLPVE